MRNDLNEESSATLAHYWDVLRRRRFYLVVTPLVCAAIVFLLSTREDEMYRAQALLRVESEAIDTDVQLLTTSAVRADVQAELGDDFAEVREVTAARIGETQLISIDVESTSPSVAAVAATAWAEAYRDRRNEELSGDLRAEREQLLAIADELSPQIVAVQAEMQALEELDAAEDEDTEAPQVRLAQLQSDLVRLEAQQRELNDRALAIDAQVFELSRTVEVAEQAGVPRSPVSPQPVRSAATGFFAGLLLGVVAAAIAELFDDPVWDEEDAERWSGGVPVLATIPAAPPVRRAGGSRVITLNDPGHPVSEAYRVLKTSIEYQALDAPINQIMITSPDAGEGKTMTSVNLAVTFAKAGSNVALVDADLRLGAVKDTMGLTTRGGGLAKVLGGTVSVKRALVPVSGSSPGRLEVIVAGEAPASPSELVASDRMSDVLGELARSHGTVIVDTPPMLAVSDGLIMAGYVDGVVMVVRSRRTRGRALKRAVERVDQSGVRVLGLVLNDDRRRLQTSVYRYSNPTETRTTRAGVHSAGRR